ncbi:general transcription factor IIIC subunit l(2)37Cd isoform X2 [Calliopsis andreniformis]|uniref:general transcription factor IIIC subunit l(2)37Cd isoform X2 n=1 Tax=Calliopsis andreniformis TaxID=337506 RepID=UPI003FCCD463
MNEPSDASDEISDTQDDKDEDFNINDYREEIDSDDSYHDITETNKNNALENNQKGSDELQENEYIGPVLPGGHRFDRRFICVKYPGNIINTDKAIETLGGISNISTAVNTPNRRLELRFRPDDIYSKPACGDKYNVKGFLLRVRVKKSRIRQVEETEAKKTKELSTKMMDIDVPRSNNNTQTKLDKGQLPKTHDIEPHCSNTMNKDEEQIISDLTARVHSCSVSTLDDIFDASRKNPFFENSLKESSTDNDVTSTKSKKAVPPTFDSKKYEDLSQNKDYELPKLKVLGQVDTEFKFTNLCDFQYLSMTESKENPKKLECIYDKIYPANIPHYSWLKNDVPYFLPPAAFSRMDTIQQYVPKTETNSYPENIIGKNRKRKTGFSNFIYFSIPEVPCKPPAGIETAMKVKFVQNIHFEQFRQLFEERPIWSKNAIMYKTKFSNEWLKILLPAVAYYFVTGPWKIMWVKLGYDPRKDIAARKYQTLDYRLKAMRGVSSQERSNRKEQDMNENVYIYREGMIPPSRQMFYQYCDILVDEIQEMLAKLPDPLPNTKCHEKRGWLPIGFDVQCREIINRQVRAVLRKQMNIPDDHPTSLPRKRKRGIKLKLNKHKTLKSREKKKETESVSSVEESIEKYDEPTTSNVKIDDS